MENGGKRSQSPHEDLRSCRQAKTKDQELEGLNSCYKPEVSEKPTSSENTKKKQEEEGYRRKRTHKANEEVFLNEQGNSEDEEPDKRPRRQGSPLPEVTRERRTDQKEQ